MKLQFYLFVFLVSQFALTVSLHAQGQLDSPPGQLAIPSSKQLDAIWILKHPAVVEPSNVRGTASSFAYTVSEEINEMPWGRDRYVAFQKLSEKLRDIQEPTVYFPTHDDTDVNVGVIGIRGRYVKGFKDFEWPIGFVDPQPVIWTHLTFAGIRNSALPGGHKDGNKFGCWQIDPSAFEKKIIPVDTLVEQELLSNSAVKSKFSVYPAPSIFRPYFDTSETTRWCKKHYPNYVTAFSTGEVSGQVGDGNGARYANATFLFLKPEAGFRVDCHRSVPNAVILFPVDEKVIIEAPGALKLPLLNASDSLPENFKDDNDKIKLLRDSLKGRTVSKQ